MNETSYLASQLNLSSSNFLLLLLLLPLGLIYTIFKHINSSSSKSKSLPPGPNPWPIVGNILHMGKEPHISLTNFAKIHGPLISLRLGTQLLVVGSSPRAATEILKNQDRLLSARYLPKASPVESHVIDQIGLVWASTGSSASSWKFLRALCRTELFSPKAIESHAALRENKAREMVEFLVGREGKVVNVAELVFDTIFNTMSNLIFSKDLTTSGLKSLIQKIMMAVASPNIADFYPIFARLDPCRLKSRVSKYLEEFSATWAMDIKERRESFILDSPRIDFLDVFLANGFPDIQINWLAMELFSAATDTTTTTIEWAMAELLKNKEIMKKVREELEGEIKGNVIKESRVSQLPYLDACVKETLRLHAPVPFLLPHCALESCEVMNYRIPKNSQVFVNVWAIGRDLSIWEDPLSFKPERFLGSNLDYKGQDYEFLPFGSGRRSCPALPMAARQVPLILASLIHCFDWSLSTGEDLANLDMNEQFGLTLHKEQPLLLVPKTRQ